MTDDYGHADVYRGRIEVTAWCLSPWRVPRPGCASPWTPPTRL